MSVRRPLLRCSWSLALALFVACDDPDPRVAVPLPPQVLAPAPPPRPLPIPPLPLTTADKSALDGDDPEDPDLPIITWSSPTADGDHLVFLREAGGQGHVWHIDADGPRRIYPPPGEAATIVTAAHTVDGSLVFIVVDEGDDTPVLLILDRESGEELDRRPVDR
jgi:hypothetical protein